MQTTPIMPGHRRALCPVRRGVITGIYKAPVIRTLKVESEWHRAVSLLRSCHECRVANASEMLLEGGDDVAQND